MSFPILASQITHSTTAYFVSSVLPPSTTNRNEKENSSRAPPSYHDSRMIKAKKSTMVEDPCYTFGLGSSTLQYALTYIRASQNYRKCRNALKSLPIVPVARIILHVLKRHLLTYDMAECVKHVRICNCYITLKLH